MINVRILTRVFLALVFGLMGALVAKIVAPEEVAGDNAFLVIPALALGIFGLIAPDFASLAGRAGLAALAKAIATYIAIPTPQLPRILGPKKKTFGKYVNPLVCDTSVLVDGRIVEVAKTGFILGTLLVIPSVVSELHKLSDSADEIKRSRGRRGLDNLAAIKTAKNLKVEMLSSQPKDAQVDHKLISLAAAIKAPVLTVDFNLNKVAKVRGVAVLNINELSNAVKIAVLPGDRLEIRLTAHGRERNQGVGYLADGTMVVVEGGDGLVGKGAEIVVTKVLQTAAGKMIFARLR